MLHTSTASSAMMVVCEVTAQTLPISVLSSKYIIVERKREINGVVVQRRRVVTLSPPAPEDYWMNRMFMHPLKVEDVSSTNYIVGIAYITHERI